MAVTAPVCEGRGPTCGLAGLQAPRPRRGGPSASGAFRMSENHFQYAEPKTEAARLMMHGLTGTGSNAACGVQRKAASEARGSGLPAAQGQHLQTKWDENLRVTQEPSCLRVCASISASSGWTAVGPKRLGVHGVLLQTRPWITAELAPLSPHLLEKGVSPPCGLWRVPGW